MDKKTNQHKTNGGTVRKSINFISVLILDRIFPSVRLFFWPFHAINVLTRVINNCLWLANNEYIKRKFMFCGKRTRIYGRFRVTGARNIYIGHNVHINDNAFIRAEGGLHIDDNVHISRNLVLYTMNHNYQGSVLPYDESKILKPVRIKRNVWIGMNVVIIPGITIGEGAIIGMGTVVSRDVPPLSIIGSPPVRELKIRNEEHYHQLEQNRKYGGMGGHPIERDQSQTSSGEKQTDY